MHLRSFIVSATALSLIACGKDSSGPTITPAAADAIARFDYLADSAAAAGATDEAEIYTGAAEAIRVAGDVGTIGIDIDGATTDFSALSLQLALPAQEFCDEFGCETVPAVDEHFLVAWQEMPLGRVLFVAKSGTGTRSLEFDTTAVDTMTAPPPGVALVGDENGESWFSIAGTTNNSAVSVGGECARPREQTPGISYNCAHATYRWSADFTAGEADGDAIGTEHHIVIPSTVVAGARLSVANMSGRVATKIGRAPVRSRLVLKRDRARASR
jgi:hypothetical protein